MENSKKSKFQCEICKRTDVRVLWPSEKGFICISCHWKYKIPVGWSKPDTSKKEDDIQPKSIPYWKDPDEIY